MSSEPLQHVPIFVGSTYEDMVDYRRAVLEGLTQLEAIVRGMEYFGSRPGTPTDECLDVVRSCEVYVGLFGMRYGSIPTGSEISMTHLEYDEAQRKSLPSLIYLIDENNQPILPKYVETGPGADKLRELKIQLKQKHMVSVFTTPESLSSRILHDVPSLLKKTGKTVVQHQTPKVAEDDDLVLNKARLLPKRMKGQEFIVRFPVTILRSVGADECEALNLEPGASIYFSTKLTTGHRMKIYVSGDMAERIIEIEEGDEIQAQVMPVFGVNQVVEVGDDGAITNFQEHSGLLLRSLIETD